MAILCMIEKSDLFSARKKSFPPNAQTIYKAMYPGKDYQKSPKNVEIFGMGFILS